MFHANKTTNSLFHITHPLLIALSILPLAFLCPRAKAATNDNAFNRCAQEMDQLPGTLTTDHWHKTPLPPKLAQLEDPTLYGSIVLRWISLKNQNGTTTIVIFTRGPGLQFQDDPDEFDVFLEKEGYFYENSEVAVNDFAFSKQSSQGVNDLLFCTKDVIFKWKWKKNNWEFYSRSIPK